MSPKPRRGLPERGPEQSGRLGGFGSKRDTPGPLHGTTGDALGHEVALPSALAAEFGPITVPATSPEAS